MEGSQKEQPPVVGGALFVTYPSFILVFSRTPLPLSRRLVTGHWGWSQPKPWSMQAFCGLCGSLPFWGIPKKPSKGKTLWLFCVFFWFTPSRFFFFSRRVPKARSPFWGISKKTPPMNLAWNGHGSEDPLGNTLDIGVCDEW